MELKDIKALVKLMRAQGIAVLKTSDIELALHPNNPTITRRRKKVKGVEPEPLLKGEGFRGYTDEELLLWSSAPVGGEDAEDNAV
jgi:hypothetical protein